MPRSDALTRSLASARTWQRFEPRIAPPGMVRLSYWIILASTALGFVGQVVRAVTTDWGAYVAEHAHWFQRNGRWMQLTPEGVIATVIFTFALGVTATVLWLVVARSVLRGRGWARVVVTASAVLGVATLPWSFGTTGLAAVWGIVSLVVGIASAVLLWLPRSRRYFVAAKAERRRFKAERIRYL